MKHSKISSETAHDRPILRVCVDPLAEVSQNADREKPKDSKKH